MGVDDWVRLLYEQPQFFSICDKTFDGRTWAKLLADWPTSDSKVVALSLFPVPRDEMTDWRRHPGGDWEQTIRCSPPFAEKCPWERLDGRDWAMLLRKQPQFARYCDRSKLGEQDWKWLLSMRPELFGQLFPWEWLLSTYPHLAFDKDIWLILGGREWVHILLMGSDSHASGGNGWNSILAEMERFDRKWIWEKMGGEDWRRLLREHPRFANRCDWEKLSDKDWMELLSRQPRFVEHCDLAGLLARHPKYADAFAWKDLDGKVWARLLRKYPQFTSKCTTTMRMKLLFRRWIDGFCWGRATHKSKEGH